MPDTENALINKDVPSLQTTKSENLNIDAPRQNLVTLWLVALIGPAAAVWAWSSALSFIPVPWPDDSAFYFVAKDLFHWPPRWVMLPQAPFEPSYRIWNFNTMPLYPILIGLGRLIGIDGSHALKVWPLSFWALSSSFLGVTLYKQGLPKILCALVALAIALDPELRWASVLVRPESLIGLTGIILVTGLSLGWFTKKDYEHSVWDPIAALLALGAYAHFNAVHLLFAVVPALIFRPRRLLDISLKTSIYLMPWLLTVALKPQLFFQQMTLQWQRLAVGNDWLHSVPSAIHSIFQALGSPEEWPSILNGAAVGIWLLIFAAVGAAVGALAKALRHPKAPPTEGITLVPAAGWIIGAIWLWHNKPEVWFVYYLHLAVWTFAGLALLKLWRLRFLLALGSLSALTTACVAIFFYASALQAQKLGQSQTWNWKTYEDFVDCIDHTLTPLQKTSSQLKPFQVWAPTFPDVTIELSRRHPDWEFSRTNDFHSRSSYAIHHGFEVDAMVVTETLNWTEANIDAPWSEHPDVHSVWMDWEGYYLNRFMKAPGWKPNRHLCQKGRWQAFIFMR